MKKKKAASHRLVNPTRKIRGDAVLKKLPEKRQDKIAEFARTHTIYETAEWLDRAGTKVSCTSLSEFLSHYRISQQLERNAAAVKAAQWVMLQQDPSLTPEYVQKVGQSFFSGLAIDGKDPRVWQMTQQIELQKGKLQLEWQKYRDAAEERRAMIKKSLKAAKKGHGISSETLEQIERELKLM